MANVGAWPTWSLENSDQRRWPTLNWQRGAFLRDQFDVQTLSARWFGNREADDSQTELLARKFRTLGDDQTIALLATGPKAFTLPEEHNFIHLYQTVARSNENVPALIALDRLTEIHLARDQRPRAADDLREAIRRAGNEKGDPARSRLAPTDRPVRTLYRLPPRSSWRPCQARLRVPQRNRRSVHRPEDRLRAPSSVT